ncbi:MAG: hypothetical protein QXQ57_00445 [Sulfolobales archaeon]
MEIISVWITTVFMLDPDITLFIRRLGEKGYITAYVKPTIEGASITFLEPPGVIAKKGSTKIEYDFGRRRLDIESPTPKDAINTLSEVESVLKDIGVDIDKALVPYEVIVIANSFFKPKFLTYSYNFKDLLGFNLRPVSADLVMEGGDPNTNRWFQVRILPIWSSYKGIDRENLYRVTVIYRDERTRILNFLENLVDILKKIADEV